MEEIKILDFDKLDEAYKFMNKYTNDLGFIIKNSISDRIKRKESIYIEKDGEIVAICNFNKRKDKVVVLYEIVTREDVRGKGYGKKLINYIINIYGRIILKCPVNNSSNFFYEKLGGKILKIEEGKKRKLNLWLLTRNISNVTK